VCVCVWLCVCVCALCVCVCVYIHTAYTALVTPPMIAFHWLDPQCAPVPTCVVKTSSKDRTLSIKTGSEERASAVVYTENTLMRGGVCILVANTSRKQLSAYSFSPSPLSLPLSLSLLSLYVPSFSTLCTSPLLLISTLSLPALISFSSLSSLDLMHV
jgi:hypothetical protein